MKPGERLRALRYMVGLTAADFAGWLDIPTNRYRNIEKKVAKMHEEDFSKIAEKIPETLEFLLTGKPLSRTQLLHGNKLLSSIPQRIDAGIEPKYFNETMLTD